MYHRHLSCYLKPVDECVERLRLIAERIISDRKNGMLEHFSARNVSLDFVGYLKRKSGDFSKGKILKYLNSCISQLNFC